MNSLVDFIYVMDDPLQTAVKLILVLACVELFAVACAYLGGRR